MKRLAHLTALLVPVISLLAGPVLAQPSPPGTMMDSLAARIPSEPSKVTTTDAMQVLDKYATCLVTMHARLADTATGPFPKKTAMARALNEPGVEPCFQTSAGTANVGMRFNYELLRGAVFKAKYRQRHKPGQPAFTMLATDWAPLTDGMNSNTAKRFTIFHKIAECALAAAPEPVHQIVIANYGGDTHRAAFTRLAPVIGDCLPEGLQLELPRPSLAGALAEVAYRSAEAKAP